MVHALHSLNICRCTSRHVGAHAHKHCHACLTCATHNVGKSTVIPQAAHPSPTRSFGHLMINFIELTPSEVKKYWLVMVDMWSKCVEAFPSSKQCKKKNCNDSGKSIAHWNHHKMGHTLIIGLTTVSRIRMEWNSETGWWNYGWRLSQLARYPFTRKSEGKLTSVSFIFSLNRTPDIFKPTALCENNILFYCASLSTALCTCQSL